MIDTLYLANYIETALNENLLGKQFLIFADEGDLVKSTKYGNQVKTYTHGLLEVISSQVTPVKSLRYQEMSMQLMIIADLNYGGKLIAGDLDREQSRNLVEIKSCLDGLINALNGQAVSITDDDRTYTMAFSFSQPTDGQKMSLGEISDGLPLYLNFSVVLFENGVNGSDYDIIIDGENQYFTSAVISRVKVTEQNPHYNGNNSKASILNNGLGIDLIIPQTTSTVSGKIENEILDGTDKAYCVILKRGTKRTPYICTSLKSQQSIALATNIGFNLSLAEAVEECLDFEENKWIQIRETVGENIVNSYFFNASGGEIVIFWGDGTKEITSSTEIIHNYESAGVYDIYAFFSNATTSNWFYSTNTVYTITYNLNGGTVSEPNPETYTRGTRTFTLNNPTMSSGIWNFIGWRGTGIDGISNSVTIPIGSTGDREYEAIFSL